MRWLLHTSSRLLLAMSLTSCALVMSFDGYDVGSGSSADDELSSLVLEVAPIEPPFEPGTQAYTASVPGRVLTPTMTTVTATVRSPGATLEIDGAPATSGKPSAPIALGLGTTQIDVAVTSAGGLEPRHYGITVTSEPASDYLKASNTRAEAQFGASVAVSDTTVVVGSTGEESGVTGDQTDTSAPFAGAAYVFTHGAAGWAQQAYLKAFNPRYLAAFGTSIALSVDTAAVGSPGESSNATGVNGDPNDTSELYSGAAYVFVRSAESWSQQAYVKASNTSGSARFGSAVALSDDTLAVGAPWEASDAKGVNMVGSGTPAGQAGAAYVFVRSGSTWAQEAYVKASNTHSQAYFGNSIALSGDTLAVGSPGDGAGGVYVFVRSGGAWTQQAYLKASTLSQAAFGTSVALSGDTLAVGAPYDTLDTSAPKAGAVYVFVRTGTTWTEQASFKASEQTSLFGRAVALSGDVLVVGSTEHAYVFERSGAAWSERVQLTGSYGMVGPFKAAPFGGSVALASSLLAVGSPWDASSATGVNGNRDDQSAPEAGAAYLF